MINIVIYFLNYLFETTEFPKEVNMFDERLEIGIILAKHMYSVIYANLRLNDKK